MEISRLDQRYGKRAENKIQQAKGKTVKAALACLETFYYAFNNKDIAAFKEVWLDHRLVQLDNPLGGIIYGRDEIVDLYRGIFDSKSEVWVEFNSIIAFEGEDIITFAGRETGEFSKNGETLPLQIRTSRILGYIASEDRWFLIHHHGSIDDAGLLSAYQRAVKA